MYLAQLAGKRVAILGAGREGCAAAQAIVDAGIDCHLVVLDEAAVDGIPAGLTGAVGSLVDAHLEAYDILLRSPGISCYRPELLAARAAGVTVTTGTNLWFDQRPKIPLVAVTGTKGKSTTCSLIAHFLSSAGHTVELVGNIGRPLLSLDPEPAADFVVVELSSYQLADFTGRVDLAVLTNLRADHLDWHGSLEQYRQDKLRLLGQAESLVLGGELAPYAALCGGPVHWFDASAGWRVDSAGIEFANDRRYPPPDWTLRGRHNGSNLAAAIAAITALGCDPGPGLAALGRFESLPHRLQTVVNTDRIRCVDDSISTTPESTVAALESYSGEAVVLIVGGHDRGLDWTPVVERLRSQSVRLVITQGDNGARIARAIGSGVERQEVATVANLEAAVGLAMERLDQGTILLSPGAPSFDQFKNFVARGERFAGLCQAALSAA